MLNKFVGSLLRREIKAVAFKLEFAGIGDGKLLEAKVKDFVELLAEEGMLHSVDGLSHDELFNTQKKNRQLLTEDFGVVDQLLRGKIMVNTHSYSSKGSFFRLNPHAFFSEYEQAQSAYENRFRMV